MPIKQYKPVTPAQRYKTTSTFEEITKTKPEKSLTVPLKKTGGRNNMGRITSRRRGGGHKRMYRIIDFRRNKTGVPARVAAIEYDPNRSARIALLHYVDGEKRYIICPVGLKVGDMVESGPKAPLKIGNSLPLSAIPTGTMVHNVEMTSGKGGQAVRSAGTSAQVMAKEGNYVLMKFPSGEIRMVRKECISTIGQVGNRDHEIIVIGKAGRSRWLGRRPKVRGVAMNPVDHPMGGGEGKSSGGRHPVSPWGKPAKGGKTRRAKLSDKYIVTKRTK